MWDWGRPAPENATQSDQPSRESRLFMLSRAITPKLLIKPKPWFDPEEKGSGGGLAPAIVQAGVSDRYCSGEIIYVGSTEGGRASTSHPTKLSCLETRIKWIREYVCDVELFSLGVRRVKKKIYCLRHECARHTEQNAFVFLKPCGPQIPSHFQPCPP